MYWFCGLVFFIILVCIDIFVKWLVSSMHILCHLKTESSTYFLLWYFLLLMPLIYFLLLMSLTGIANTMLNNGTEGRQPCLVPDFRGEAFSFSPLNRMLALSLLFLANTMLRYVPSTPILLSVLSQTDVESWSDVLSVSITVIMWFPPPLQELRDCRTLRTALAHDVALIILFWPYTCPGCFRPLSHIQALIARDRG